MARILNSKQNFVLAFSTLSFLYKGPTDRIYPDTNLG